MDNENGRSMDMELEHEEDEKEVTEFESDEEEEDEIEELEEMTSPRLSCRIGDDGQKHHEIVVINNNFDNKLHMMEPCSICYLPFSTQGNHQICCLPCGHLYGFSCIKNWLQIESGGKCPLCNTLCSYKDVILLHARGCASAHQKTASTRHFPFTKQGLIEFKEHERLRHVDAKKMYDEDYKRLVDVLERQSVVADQRVAIATHLDDLSKREEELGQYDAFRLRAFRIRHDALQRQYDALGQRADVLKQRTDVLERWLSACKPTLKFFTQMYKEHLEIRRRRIMGDENDRTAETELEYEEEEEEKEDELDELDELEEITSPRLSYWVGADGQKHHEIMVINNNNFNNKLQMMQPCSICYLPFSTQGNHQICCLPCGHLYGLSCIKKCLIQSSSGGKCPQCNTLCKYKDVILLYAFRGCASAHQKTSSIRHFPFNKQGIREFREHERLRFADTEKMQAENSKKLVDVLEHQYAVVNKRTTLLTQLDDLLARAEELEQWAENLGQADTLRRQAGALKRRADALGHRYDALGQRADVLKQRKDELERRLSAITRSFKFFNKMYMEHKVHQMKIESCVAAPICHKN